MQALWPLYGGLLLARILSGSPADALWDHLCLWGGLLLGLLTWPLAQGMLAQMLPPLMALILSALGASLLRLDGTRLLEITLVSVGAGLWMGATGQRWKNQKALQEAERMWQLGEDPREILDLLERLGPWEGELGFRAWQLMSFARSALGQRTAAWQAIERAHLARVPIPLRWCLAAFLRRPPSRSRWRVFLGERLYPLAPRMPRLSHAMALGWLQANTSGSVQEAWHWLREKTWPCASEDPFLLQDLLHFTLAHGFLAEGRGLLRQLWTKFGDPRIRWDRVSAMAFLGQRGEHAEALALARQMPNELRGHPGIFHMESMSFRSMGDLHGASHCLEQGLHFFPKNFELRMEQHDVAMLQRKRDEALDALERAWGLLASGGPVREAQVQLWHLKRAAFALDVEDDPETAWKEIQQVPQESQGNFHPPLRLRIQLALGDFEAAHLELQDLLKSNPEDPDLQLAQADCLLGLEAHEALLAYLNDLGEFPRQRAAYWHLRGLGLAHLGDYLGARMDLEQAAQMEPWRVRYVLDAGHACAELGEWARSEQHWRQALRLDARNEEALIQLSDARAQLHDPDGSKSLLRECLLHHPGSEGAQERLAELEAN